MSNDNTNRGNEMNDNEKISGAIKKLTAQVHPFQDLVALHGHVQVFDG